MINFSRGWKVRAEWHSAHPQQFLQPFNPILHGEFAVECIDQHTRLPGGIQRIEPLPALSKSYELDISG
jgi:hypothetical protein